MPLNISKWPYVSKHLVAVCIYWSICKSISFIHASTYLSIHLISSISSSLSICPFIHYTKREKAKYLILRIQTMTFRKIHSLNLNFLYYQCYLEGMCVHREHLFHQFKQICLFGEFFFLSDFCFKGLSTYFLHITNEIVLAQKNRRGNCLFIFIYYPEFKMIFMKLILRILIVQSSQLIKIVFHCARVLERPQTSSVKEQY